MKCKRLALLLSVLVLSASVALTLRSGKVVPAEDYDVKLEAAQIMQRCMDQVKVYKQELGLPIHEEDWFHTGMIGDRFTGITPLSVLWRQSEPPPTPIWPLWWFSC